MSVSKGSLYLVFHLDKEFLLGYVKLLSKSRDSQKSQMGLKGVYILVRGISSVQSIWRKNF